MATWGLDKNGDFAITNNSVILLTDNEEIVQNVETRVKEQIFDCFVNLNAGIDWLNLPRNKSEIEALTNNVRKIVSATNGVTGILDISANLDNASRNLKIVVRYKTKFTDENVSQFLFDK